MSDVSFHKENLLQLDKEALIEIILSQQDQLKSISRQLDFLTEQIALMNQRAFGRKTEQAGQMQQMTLFDYFNEAEFKSDDSSEPEITEVVISSYARKKKTKREEKLEGLPARIYEHTLSEEELAKLFPDGYKELPVETYKRLAIIPQTLLVDEHYVHVYASKKNDGTIVRASRPNDLFRNSIATPSIVATIMTGKYQNHLPLNRQIEAFQSNGIRLEENTLANWMIKASDTYLSVIYDRLHRHLYDSKVLHADETPFEVIKDGRPAGAKSYMWVYRSGACGSKKPVIIYNYQPTRKAEHPDEFLKNYSGTLVTDGYQVYHTIEKRRTGLKIAGCWVHAKRKFSEIVKAVGAAGVESSTASIGVKKISRLFYLDSRFDLLPPNDRKRQRQIVLKPKVDAFFEWAKRAVKTLPATSATAKAINYCLNQEQFLRAFLDDGNIPMDNNLAEQAIRPFTLGRKNWVVMSSPKGADASAIIYSLVETAKANSLRVHDYLELLLSELSSHPDDRTESFIENLMPWSDFVREKCHILKNFQG